MQFDTHADPPYWAFQGVRYRVTIAASTYKHGRTDDDVWAVLNAPLVYAMDGTDEHGRERVMVLGIDTHNNGTEVLALLDEQTRAVIVHAHKPTAHTRKLLGR